MNLSKIVLIALLLFASKLYALERLPEQLEVRIFSGQSPMGFRFQPIKGRYHVLDRDGKVLMELAPGDFLHVGRFGQHLQLAFSDSIFFVEGGIFFEGKHWENAFLVKPDDLGYRTYDDHLEVKMPPGDMRLINRVALDRYVAGVVMSESGLLRHEAFYRVQAIIARTYALRHTASGQHAGYDLCDMVHCQAYYGRSAYVPILEAVFHSSGEVATDMAGGLINAVYHANCGGQTMAAEDVWLQAEPYLKSVEDPFCTSSPGATWKASITVEQLLSFVRFYHPFPLERNQLDTLLNFSQKDRNVSLPGFPAIRLPMVRLHFGWRSAFFSFKLQNGHLLVSGRGYGHGVGLCQEGAMRMAVLGYDAHEIISTYYQGVKVISLEE